MMSGEEKAVTLTQGHTVTGVVFWRAPSAALALPYQALKCVELSADGAVVLKFAEHIVTLKGSGLERLPKDFILQRVVSVRISRRAELHEGGEGAEIVEKIEINAEGQNPRSGAEDGANVGPAANRRQGSATAWRGAPTERP